MAARTLDPDPELTDPEKLRKYWYAKLKKNGFKDIESFDGKYLDEWSDRYFCQRYTPQEFEEKQEYYNQCSAFYWRFNFKNKLEKEIWRCYSDGLGSRLISRSLRSKFKSIKINKDNVNKIVQRLIEEMKCFSFDD